MMTALDKTGLGYDFKMMPTFSDSPQTPQAVVEALEAGTALARLDLRRLNAVIDFSPEDAVITVQTGMTLANLDLVLAPHELMWPLGYPNPTQTLLSDVLSEDRLPIDLATGWLGDLKALPRDWVLGGQTACSVIAQNGNVAGTKRGLTRWGGKVVKNVTGYDMRQVYIGGRSVFGVITEVTLRLVSRLHAQRVFELAFDRFDSAATTALQLAEICRPWLTRLIIIPTPHTFMLQGILSGQAKALDSLMLAHGLEAIIPEAISQVNTYAATFWHPDHPPAQEHAFALGNSHAMADVIATLPPDTPWLAWPEPGWLMTA